MEDRINKMIATYMAITKTDEVDLKSAMAYAYKAGYANKANELTEKVQKFLSSKAAMIAMIVIAAIIVISVAVSSGHRSIELKGKSVNELVDSYTEQTGIKVWPYRRNLIKQECAKVDESKWPEIVLKICKDGEGR